MNASNRRLKDYLTVQVTNSKNVLCFKNITLLEKGPEGYDFPCYALFISLKDSLMDLQKTCPSEDVVEFHIGYGESAKLVCDEYLGELTNSRIEERVEDCLVYLDCSESGW